MPTYSGGLGVLAGDTLCAAADLGLPMVGVTLLHQFRQPPSRVQDLLRCRCAIQGHQDIADLRLPRRRRCSFLPRADQRQWHRQSMHQWIGHTAPPEA